MTREEKVNALKAIIEEREEYQQQRKEALFEIIKDLEQESCADCISREDTLKKFKQIYFDNDTVVRCAELVLGGMPPVTPEQQLCEDCISRQYLLDNCVVDKVTMPYVPVSKIENAPPVAPQPKTGRWILVQRDKYIDVNCSVCGSTRLKGYAYGYSVDELDVDQVNDLLTKIRMDYCEHCGAKIEKVKKNEISE